MVTSADTVTTTTVTITINGANEAPTLTKGTGTVTEDTSVNDAGKLVATGTVSSSGGDWRGRVQGGGGHQWQLRNADD